jgi:Outer membrane cobalamin receptor protein
MMRFAFSTRLRPQQLLPHLLAFILILFCGLTVRAASIRGLVTDATGAKVTGANVAVVSNGKVIASAVSTADGSFEVITGTEGRFFLVVSAKSFRQLQTPEFYAGQLDSVERKIVLEPEWVRQSIVVTATGVPTPQAQTSATTSVLTSVDLEQHSDLTGVMRLMPGATVVQQGQRGAQSSLFVRGGGSNDNKILLDGVDVGDLGNQFDLGPLSASGIESVEVYRGPNSNLFGSGAMTSVVSMTTPHGTTSFPSIIIQGDAGNFNTTSERAELSGARKRLDYLGAFNWLQTSNSLPFDQHHVATSTANVGWQHSASTQLRATMHYGVSATGVPNAWDFYQVADNATQKDQQLFLSASIDNQTTASIHNSVRYGLSRKRQQLNLWQLSGNPVAYSNYCYGPGTLGEVVTIKGANGYSATGQATLDCSTYHAQYASNRDALIYRGDITITPHLIGLVGFQYQNERGAQPGSTYYPPVGRTNYDYIAAVHGDFKQRFFYTLGGSLEHYSLFGTQTSPRAGFSLYALRPRPGIFSGTRIQFNFGDAVREPKLTDQDYSLYTFLLQNGGQSTIDQLHISQLQAPYVRTYEGGLEQSFWSGHIIFTTTYFHNQFGREIEFVGLDLIPQLLPNLSAAQQQQLAAILQANFAYELALNSEAYKAQGFETSVETGIGRELFFRGGYTYLDAVVQRSFTNDDAALLGPIPTFADGTPIGPYSPLKGARPFRRPPHTGFFTATWSRQKFTVQFTSAFASRSDDSTYLAGSDVNGGNSLLLPNRNLDYGWARLDLGGTYQLLPWLSIYGQANNLLSQRHIAPIGYPSLPMNFRTGLRVNWGLGAKRQ